jgi:hypothetical protein
MARKIGRSEASEVTRTRATCTQKQNGRTNKGQTQTTNSSAVQPNFKIEGTMTAYTIRKGARAIEKSIEAERIAEQHKQLRLDFYARFERPGAQERWFSALLGAPTNQSES